MSTKKNNKYYKNVEPNLEKVTEMSKKKYGEREIAKQLNISYALFNNYKKQYKALQSAIDEGRAALVADVSDSLIESATDRYVVETKTKINYYYDKDGNKQIGGEEVVKTERFIPANLASIVLILKQYDRQHITGHKFTNLSEQEEEFKERDLDIKESKGGSDEWE